MFYYNGKIIHVLGQAAYVCVYLWARRVYPMMWHVLPHDIYAGARARSSCHVVNPCTRLCRGRVVFRSSAECSVPGYPPLPPIGWRKAGRYLTTAHVISRDTRSPLWLAGGGAPDILCALSFARFVGHVGLSPLLVKFSQLSFEIIFHRARVVLFLTSLFAFVYFYCLFLRGRLFRFPLNILDSIQW